MRETIGKVEIKNVHYAYSSYWRCGSAMGRLTLCYFIDDMNTLHYGWTVCHERVKVREVIYPMGVVGNYVVTAIARGDQFKKVIGRGRAYQALLKRPASIVHNLERSPIKEILNDIDMTTNLVYLPELPKMSERA